MAEPQQQQQVVADLDFPQLLCSVCLDLLKEPVTVPCGHSYCRSCIDGCWRQQEEEKNQSSCPQCREVFHPRPALRKNTMLAEVVEKLKETRTNQTPPPADLPVAGPLDVACDFCCDTRRYKASMSCLTCLASYCPVHLEPHYTVPALKIHQLVSVTIPLKQKICTKHNKLMEVYCQTDDRCLCYLCALDYHQGHRTSSAATERARAQELLIIKQTTVKNRLTERERELSEVVQAMKDFKSCSQTALKSIDEVIDDLISSIQERRSLTKMNIQLQEKAAVAKAKELQFHLEEEISKLSKRNADLQQLSHSNDHIYFIQTFKSLSLPCESPDLPLDAVARPRRSMNTVTDSVRTLKAKMEVLLNDASPKICATVRAVDVLLPPVPKTREEFVDNCCTLTLDPNTVNNLLAISKERRRITTQPSNQYYFDHSDRFKDFSQVLCKEGLSGRHYWEVGWKSGSCAVAVAYKDISRSSTGSEFGRNNKSWSLECSSGSYTFRHNSRPTSLSGPSSTCVGVYLNYKAGTLSFYSVSNKMTLLHKEQATFTQRLYPGIGLKSDSSVSTRAELVKLW